MIIGNSNSSQGQYLSSAIHLEILIYQTSNAVQQTHYSAYPNNIWKHQKPIPMYIIEIRKSADYCYCLIDMVIHNFLYDSFSTLKMNTIYTSYVEKL